MSNPPQSKAVVSYAERKKNRGQLDGLKKQGPPLGGAPPIPEGKLAGLVPQPDFGDAPMDVPQDFRQPVEPPRPIGGVGSAYAVNQALAQGRTGGPVSMGEAARRGLAGTQKMNVSPETQELLQGVKNATESSEPEQEAPKKQNGEKSVQEGLEEAGETIAKDNAPPDLPFNLDTMDSLRDELINEERRKAIEAELEPLDVADLLTKREIQQSVPTIKGKLVYQLRTFSERELIWCMKHVYNYPGSQRYVEELFNMFKVTCAIVGFNGKFLPDHRKNLGRPDEEIDKDLFEKKYNIIISFPVQVIADLGVQCAWFHNRVTALWSLRTIKNG
jgi:hypothetical protein